MQTAYLEDQAHELGIGVPDDSYLDANADDAAIAYAEKIDPEADELARQRRGDTEKAEFEATIAQGTVVHPETGALIPIDPEARKLHSFDEFGGSADHRTLDHDPLAGLHHTAALMQPTLKPIPGGSSSGNKVKKLVKVVIRPPSIHDGDQASENMGRPAMHFSRVSEGAKAYFTMNPAGRRDAPVSSGSVLEEIYGTLTAGVSWTDLRLALAMLRERSRAGCAHARTDDDGRCVTCGEIGS